MTFDDRKTGGAMKQVVAFAVALLTVSAAQAGEKQADAVYRQGEAIVYRGMISKDANAKVKRLLEDNGGIKLLDISSGGGEIGAGMDLGDLVREFALDVKITDYCASSCANYVFPAAKHKFLFSDSAVVWHGSAIQEGMGDISRIDFSEAEKQLGRKLSDEEKLQFVKKAGMFDYLDSMKRRQERFFQDIGVDQRITVFGREVGCECEWTLSVSDMERFGIRDVIAPDGYGSNLNPNGHTIRLLRLADHPDYAASIGK